VGWIETRSRRSSELSAAAVAPRASDPHRDGRGAGAERPRAADRGRPAPPVTPNARSTYSAGGRLVGWSVKATGGPVEDHAARRPRRLRRDRRHRPGRPGEPDPVAGPRRGQSFVEGLYVECTGTGSRRAGRPGLPRRRRLTVADPRAAVQGELPWWATAVRRRAAGARRRDRPPDLPPVGPPAGGAARRDRAAARSSSGPDAGRSRPSCSTYGVRCPTGRRTAPTSPGRRRGPTTTRTTAATTAATSPRPPRSTPARSRPFPTTRTTAADRAGRRRRRDRRLRDRPRRRARDILPQLGLLLAGIAGGAAIPHPDPSRRRARSSPRRRRWPRRRWRSPRRPPPRSCAWMTPAIIPRVATHS
jgi:hypothetical protein